MTNGGELVLPACAFVAKKGESAGAFVVDRELVATAWLGAEKRHHRLPFRTMWCCPVTIKGGDNDMGYLMRNRLPEEIVAVFLQHRPVVADNRYVGIAEADHPGSLAAQIEANINGRQLYTKIVTRPLQQRLGGLFRLLHNTVFVLCVGVLAEVIFQLK